MTAYYQVVARYYDAETSDKVDDLALYSQLAEQYGGPIFEVGCGTGRVMLHLAQEGHTVHGIDTSPAMLERLQIKLDSFPHLRENVHYIQGDMLKHETATRYKLAILSYNALMHFHEQDKQVRLLKRLRALLADDGLLVIDLPNPSDTFASQDNDALILDRTFIDPENGHLVMLHSTSYLDRTTQIMDVRWIYDEVTEDGTVKRLLVPHRLRYFFHAELVLLLRVAGFEVQAVYGDTDENPFEDGCERLIVYASPKQKAAKDE